MKKVIRSFVLRHSVVKPMVFSAVVMASIMGAFADGWSAPTVDFAGSSQTVVTSLVTGVQGMLPACLALFGIFWVIRAIPHWIKTFTH